MSATGRSEGVRHPKDFYETPAWCTRAIIPYLPERPGVVVDAGAGTGAIARTLVECRYVHQGQVVCVEQDRDRLERCMRALPAARSHEGDFVPWAATSRVELASAQRALVIMNPPYSDAESFVVAAIATGADVFALLRINFLGGQERARFHRENPSDVYVLPRRPSFCMVVKCKDGCGSIAAVAASSMRPRACDRCGGKVSIVTSDATEYAWFHWSPIFPVGQTARLRILEVEARS